MKENEKLTKVYTGTEVLVYILKAKLEEKGISSTIRNNSGNNFLGVVPIAIDLYIQESDLKKAESVVSEFISNN
jgi:hypothetical protein